MSKTIAIVGTADTRGDTLQYIANVIKSRGHKAVIVDVGVLQEPQCRTDITREEIAKASDSSIKDLIDLCSEAKAIAKMAEGCSRKIWEMYEGDSLDGVIGIGGSMGTDLALKVMKGLPMGFPKVILSTIAYSPFIRPDAILNDVVMVPWGTGLRGLNFLNEITLQNAAGTIIGAVELYEKGRFPKPANKKVVGISSLGVFPSKYSAQWIEPELKERNHETVIYHANGLGGRMFEQAIYDGLIDMALDLELAEVMNEVVKGHASSGPHRLEAAGKMGIPHIVSPTFDCLFWEPKTPLPPDLKDRYWHEHNSILSVGMPTLNEKIAATRFMLGKLKMAKGPTAIVIALKGRGLKTVPDFPDDCRFIAKMIGREVDNNIRFVEVDCTVNDRVFVDAVLEIVNEFSKVKPS